MATGKAVGEATGTAANARAAAAAQAAAAQAAAQARARQAAVVQAPQRIAQPIITYGTPGTWGANASGAEPETQALQTIAKIDPTTEALRTKLAGSYGDAITAQPSAAQLKSYLDVYGQVDPTTAAARKQLGAQLSSENALGAKLDPSTQREVEQATRQAQGARGNVYGTPQLVAETMARGSAGEARKTARQKALQGYLQSGQSTGDVALNLYSMGQGNLRAGQGAALSYLNSGATPYQTGAGYVSAAEAAAANAAQGGPQYNPASLGAQYGGSQFPQYGLNIGQQSQGYYNSLNTYGNPVQPKNQTAGALAGAATGAMKGAAGGGGIWGGLAGAAAGGLGGYYS